MFGKRKKTLTLKVFVVLLSLAMTTAAFSARITPSGKVVMMKDGNVIGEFSNEAPLPEGVLLKCEGQCSVKLDDVYMVVEQGTVFSVQPMAASNELFVQEGTVYYSLSESSRPLHLKTPAGNATTGDLSLSENELRGYVRVSENKTEIGVIGGGTMMVETASGEMAVAPGKQVNIAMVNQDVSAGGSEGGSSSIRNIALYAAEAAVLVGGIYLLTTIDGNSSDNDGSPSSP